MHGRILPRCFRCPPLTLTWNQPQMADRWYDAIRQGASGDKSVAAAPRGKRVLKLRMEVAEEIPEYTCVASILCGGLCRARVLCTFVGC